MDLPLKGVRRRSRLAGVFYLVTIAAGVFAEVFVREAVMVRDDPAATAANIAAHEFLYRSGLVADLIMLSAYVAVTLLFLDLFQPVTKSVSLLAALFSMVGITVLAACSLTHAAPLLLLVDGNSTAALSEAPAQALALLALRMHSRGYQIADVFFGTYCILIGYLIVKSRLVPWLLGVLMMIGGTAYLGDSFAAFLWPTVAARLANITIAGGVAELALSVWLVHRR